MVAKGTWVRIESIVLEPGERSTQLPEDTKRVPFLQWVKGRLLEDAQPGEAVAVETRTGRREQGVLVQVEPCYELGFGSFVPELLDIGDKLRGELFGKEDKA